MMQKKNFTYARKINLLTIFCLLGEMLQDSLAPMRIPLARID